MSLLVPPEVTPKPHWTEFELPFEIGSGRSFFPDSRGEVALRMAFFRSSSDDALEGMVWFGKGIEGPPHHVHGGVSSYVLDEAMGSAGWLKGLPCVAQKISFEFLRMTPIGEDLEIRSEVEKVEGRTIFIKSLIFDGQGPFTRGYGEFHWLDKNRMQKLLAEGPYELDLNTLNFPVS